MFLEWLPYCGLVVISLVLLAAVITSVEEPQEIPHHSIEACSARGAVELPKAYEELSPLPSYPIKSLIRSEDSNLNGSGNATSIVYEVCEAHRRDYRGCRGNLKQCQSILRDQYGKEEHQQALRALEQYKRKLQEMEQRVQDLSRTLEAKDAKAKATQGTSTTKQPYRRAVFNIETGAIFRNWQHINLSNDFHHLDASITRLALALHGHISTSTLLQYKIHELSDSFFLIRGASKELWARQRPLLLRGAIWSILLGTIFSNDFEVFGERARNLAREWLYPDISRDSATWCSLTAESLLIKAGIIQYDTAGQSKHIGTLRKLLHEQHSLADSVSAVANVLVNIITVNDSEMVSQHAMQRASYLFEHTDALARQSLHNARVRFIKSLDLLTGRFAAKDLLSEGVHTVITNAQILALHMVAQVNCYRFIIPTIGDMFLEVNSREKEPLLSQAIRCSQLYDGCVVFAVRPGFQMFKGADSLQMKVLYPAQVYLHGKPGIRTSKHINLKREAVKDRSVSDKASPQTDGHRDDFMEIAKEIKFWAERLTYDPDVDTTSFLQPFTIGPPSDSNTWLKMAKKSHPTESAIWAILLSTVFKDPFAAFADVGTARYKAWISLYPGVAQCLPSHIGESNDWRIFNAAQLLDRLGGEQLLKPPHNATTVDYAFFHRIRLYQMDIANRIKTLLLNISHNPPLAKIEPLVQKALLLAMKISVYKSHVEVWHPSLDATYIPPSGSEVPWLDLTEGCAVRRDGRVSFIVRPGLRQFGDTDGENMQDEMRIVPPLVCITDKVDVSAAGLKINVA